MTRRRSGRATALALTLNAACALLLFWTVRPPAMPTAAERLIVLTAAQRLAGGSGVWPRAAVVALPEAAEPAATLPAPDLATALRRAPQTRTLTVVGDGLTLRDQAAAAGLALEFRAAPPRGLQELILPTRVVLGQQWSVTGRVAPDIARVELEDPAGAVVDSVAPRADGRFRLRGVARALGPARFALRSRSAAAGQSESTSIPLVTQGGDAPPRVLLLGFANPEFKYWRRWAADAGLSVQSSAWVSEGVALRDGATDLSPAALALADLVIIDDRAWQLLRPDEKAALESAVRQGLGLLLRVDESPGPQVIADWQSYGFTLDGQPRPAAITLDRYLGSDSRTSFTAAPLHVRAAAAQPLLQADDGAAVGLRRSFGDGRVGVWTLTDSFRLQLLGDTAAYGTLWARTVGDLARAKPPSHPRPALDIGWVNERMVFCQLAPGSSVRTSLGSAPPAAGDVPLPVDADGCASYWPTSAGWQQLITPPDSALFYVRAAADGATLRSARDRRATHWLESAGAAPASASAGGRDATAWVALPRWPFALAWLSAAGALWWRERFGRAPRRPLHGS